MTFISKIATQTDLEAASFTVGVERYKEAQTRRAEREGFERRDDVTRLIRGAIPILSEALGAWINNADQGKGRKPAGLKALKALDPDVISLLALSRTFNAIGKGGSITDITIGFGRGIEVEIEAAAIDCQDPKAAQRFRDLADGDARPSATAKRHAKLAEKLELSLNWDTRRQMLTGDIVLGVILTSLSEIFARAQAVRKGNLIPVVELTDEAAEALAAMTDAAAWLHPNLQPMLTMPRPWTTLTSGCYNDVRLSKVVPLVRTYSKEHKRLVNAAIQSGQMDAVLVSTNAIQETRFAIDTRVLAMVLRVREQGLQPGKSFPVSELPALPPKLSKEEWEAIPIEQRTAQARNRKAVKDIRSAAGVDSGVFNSDTEMAQFLADEGVFYLPHSLDFRGRTYAVPHFNHQRSDHMKALFHYADAVPLGPDGGDWLMIHLANCGDFGKVSKKPFADRLAWVRENEGDILMCARYPEEMYHYWSEADESFCFLQACFEYDAWMQSGFSQDFASTLAGAADGSCSGLQHYAAMTRSATEAYHVNLVPRDTVGDIYQITADAASLTLQAAAVDTENDDHAMASRVLSVGFGRSNVKRNVMTYFYGSGKFGMRDQHMEDTMRPMADEVALGKKSAHAYEFIVPRKNKETGEETMRADGGFGCAQVLAAHTHKAVVTVAPMADEAASWIQSVAATLAHESLSMIWTTPTGLPVVQRYSEYTSKAINLWLYDRTVHVPTGSDRVDYEGNVLSRVQLLIREAPTARVAKKRMRSAASPNLVHSMDGSHLQRSVAMAKAEGINHFSMIHDSFGTHFGNMGAFNRIIREAFVATYQNYCPLTDLDTYARSVLSEEGIAKLKPIPTKGDLDLNLVRTSLYAFA